MKKFIKFFIRFISADEKGGLPPMGVGPPPPWGEWIKLRVLGTAGRPRIHSLILINNFTFLI